MASPSTPTPEDFWNGYGAVHEAAELLDRYADLVTALLDSPVVAGFCYTQLTDTAQERNGLLDEHRKPKVDPAAIRAVNQQPSAAVPADAIAEIQIVHAARRNQLGRSPAGREDRAGNWSGGPPGQWVTPDGRMSQLGFTSL